MIVGVIRRSLRKKVGAIVLLSTFVALVVSALALLSYESERYRGFMINDVQTQAEILARVTAPALAFDDRDGAATNLRLLSNRAGINAAAIYTAEGQLFASFNRTAGFVFPPTGAPGEPVIAGHAIEIFQPVVENGELLGTVYLRESYELAGRLVDYLLILGTVMGMSLIAAAFISYWLEGSVTAPVLSLTAAARKVIDERDFTVRARRTTDDEIGVLVDAFNAMLTEVGQRAEALEASNRRLQRETEERRAAEAALRLADQRKDEFLATLAHELRNPLAPMVNAMTLLDGHGSDPSLRERAHGIIQRQLRQLVRLVDDLLDVSRITSGKLVIKRERVELADVVQNAVDTVKPLLESRQQKLAVSLPQQPVYLQADPVRLAQVFSNLLNNAAKYSDLGSEIRLVASVAASSIEVRVEDPGMGISAESLPMIFEMFTQGREAARRTETGLGVGLALARRLVELHDGSIEAASEGLGRGSTFTVRLPVMAALTSERAAGKTAGVPPARRHRILLVDDNVDFVASLSLLLEGMGHDVRVAHDAAHALDAATEFRPEFAFLDIGLPDRTGYDLARDLRALPAGERTVLIALSGWGLPQDRERSREAGFALHLVKPVDLGHIQAALSGLVRRA
ncbi:MAG TPA: ATP-binding protein [Gammaproteobacteria bacterium]